MRKMLRAIGRALRAAFRRMKAAAVGGLTAIGGLFAGGYVDEPEIGNDDLVEDFEAEAAVETPRPTPSVCIASLIKRACEYKMAGRPCAPLFDINDPIQMDALGYVHGLDDAGRRLLANAPIHSIGRHIDPTDPFNLGRLPNYQRAVADVRKPATSMVSPANESRRISLREAEDALDLVDEFDPLQTLRFG